RATEAYSLNTRRRASLYRQRTVECVVGLIFRGSGRTAPTAAVESSNSTVGNGDRETSPVIVVLLQETVAEKVLAEEIVGDRLEPAEDFERRRGMRLERAARQIHGRARKGARWCWDRRRRGGGGRRRGRGRRGGRRRRGGRGRRGGR